MRIFVLTATYELRVSRKATYVTTLLPTIYEYMFTVPKYVLSCLAVTLSTKFVI
jgi:hypothetical protein